MNMKTQGISVIRMIIIACFMVNSFTSNGQLKLYTNGSLSIGSITQPPVGAELQVIGSTVFSSNTAAITSSAFIKGFNAFSNANSPDYTWYGDTALGIFHPKVNTLGVAVAGKTTMLFSQANNIVIDSTADNGDRFQINTNQNQNALDIFSHTSSNNLYSAINWVNNTTTKAWAVKNGAQDEFFVYGNGQAYSYGWNTISDSTMKENVFAIHNALNTTLKLQGVTYNLKNNNGLAKPDRYMGLIAQAVERVVPEVVTTNSNGLKTIAYSNMVGLLVEAIKDEDNKVNALQKKLDSCIEATKRISLNQNKKDNRNESDTSNQARLYPCSACPVDQQMVFHCYVPLKTKNARLMVFDMNGGLKKAITINGKSNQMINVNKGELVPGMYYYSLMIDGNEVDTKKVIMTQD
jgi:hypothetical protein